MANPIYIFKQIDQERWGIYFEDRLLASISSYEACRSIAQSLNDDLSHNDAIKAEMTYKRAINPSLILN